MNISFKSLIIIIAIGISFVAHAAPKGGNITRGTANIDYSANQTLITQQTDRLDIDWQEFPVGQNQSVIFNQPTNQSLVINRVQGGIPSQIDGLLQANGRVFVMNEAGITFGPHAQVNVGSLLATTMEIDEKEDGNFELQADHYASIVNQGNITVSPAGFAILASPYIQNEGVIRANLGEVHLVSGQKAILDFRGDQKIFFTVNETVESIKPPDTMPLGIDHTGNIEAQSGKVYLNAKQLNNAIASVINLDGVIDATSLDAVGDGGEIWVTADHFIDMRDQSTLDTSAEQRGDGGTVMVIAEQVAVAREDATMRSRGGQQSGDGGFMEFSGYDKLFVLGGNYDAQAPAGAQGTILFDPTDVTIGTLGGGFSLLTSVNQFADPDVGNGIITSALLNASLADVVIQATNNITFDADLNFANIGALLFDHLTVQAGNDIIINADITAVGDFDITMIADDATSPSNGNDGNGAITMADGAVIDVNGGTITMTAAEDITIGRLITTDASNTAIQLTSSNGGT